MRAARAIGLLGGSFDPAHAGHLHAALLARRILRLDRVWLLVSPGNPLKPPPESAFEERLAGLRALVGSRSGLVASDIERRLGSRRTVDTLERLRRTHPGQRFVWIMGMDGLAEMHRWWRWPRIFRMMPVAVVARPGWSAASAPAARRFARARLPLRCRGRLAEARPPRWTVLRGRMVTQSSTALRDRT